MKKRNKDQEEKIEQVEIVTNSEEEIQEIETSKKKFNIKKILGITGLVGLAAGAGAFIVHTIKHATDEIEFVDWNSLDNYISDKVDEHLNKNDKTEPDISSEEEKTE